jgi:dTDP-4-amino-4,6-dideoxygalactose transaminase
MNSFPVWPQFEQDEIELVVDVLSSGKTNAWVGEHVAKFEKEFADYIDMPFALAVCNGTLALELALYSLGIKSGDEVIVPSKSYVATASAVVMRGATPVFADVDINSHNISVDSIRELVTPKTKAIIIVHLGGNPCEIDEIIGFAQKNNLLVIEDCAQAHGAEYKNKKVGSFGDAAAFSFCQDKIMSTGGEGGMLLLNNETVWNKAWSFRDHGKSYEIMSDIKSDQSFPWPHTTIGTNWRLTEMQAAIGRVQLSKLSKWLKKRRKNALYLLKKLSDLDCLILPEFPDYIEHSFYRVYVNLNLEKLKNSWDKDRVIHEINKAGVACFQGSCNEMYKEKAFFSGNNRFKSLPNAEVLDKSSICFLSHHTLEQKHMKIMAESISSVLKQALQ